MQLHDLLAAADPGAPALVFEDRTWTFGALAAWVEAVAIERTAGTVPGGRVPITGRNRPEYVAALYGVPMAGRIAVPINHRLSPAEQAAQRAQVSSGGPAPEDVSWIVFTSGTTGGPKGAMLTHHGLLAAADATLAARPREDDDVYLFPFPLCHVAAYNVLVQHRAGRPLVLLAGFEVVGLQEATRRHRVTSMSLAPTMAAMLVDHPAFDPGAFATVRQVAYGASPMAPELQARLEDALGVQVVEGYGMTEASGNLAFDGRPAQGVEIRLGADGEVEARGEQLMAGYWDDPEATAEALVDGWLRTGDLGRWDEEGRLRIVDRRKDIVVTGGENVASREVEDVLATHPSVGQVAVVGVPDDRWGEVVCAVVVPADGDVSLEVLAAHARRTLGGFKVPRRLLVVDELPVNAAGKVLKRELRERAADV
jgi:acyl-CoA synthetase (AMP-forming)/AMP-acid ligase II